MYYFFDVTTYFTITSLKFHEIYAKMCQIMNATEYFSIKDIAPRFSRGAIIDMKALEEVGVSPGKARYWARNGWLSRLGEGVFRIPGDELELLSCLAYLSRKVPGLHVGGKTALAWRGVKHNLAVKERVILWGNAQVRLPSWFTEKFEYKFQVTHIFDDTLPANAGLSPLPGGDSAVLVSTPERAILELLSDAGKFQTLEETRNIFENIRNLRMDILDELLQHVTRIKVVRMARNFAEDLNLPWMELAEKNCKRLGGGKRWIASPKTGERLVLKK